MRQPRITPVVLVGDRLFEPEDVMLVERVAALQCLGRGQCLIVAMIATLVPTRSRTASNAARSSASVG